MCKRLKVGKNVGVRREKKGKGLNSKGKIKKIRLTAVMHYPTLITNKQKKTR